MKIAIYGRVTKTTDIQRLFSFLRFLTQENIGYQLYRPYAEELRPHKPEDLRLPSFMSQNEIATCQFLYSIGGDGTLLDAVRFLAPLDIPILGVNVGRLGFLAGTAQTDLEQVTLDLRKDAWKVDTRSLVELESKPDVLEGNRYGLNEVTIHKANSNEMIRVHTYLNGEFLNSYWCDGLMVSTPTGSTAYSLSCGGPIITPQSQVFVITPIAPHSLTVRPMVIPDSSVLSFEIESRSGQVLIAVDNRTILTNDKIDVAVKRANFAIRLARVTNSQYFNTLRSRLNWGLDFRN
ncbi:MAG: NAD kinase [Bacteroidia bacterium]|nr:NAD kinase [Bacteroidia bacterium]